MLVAALGCDSGGNSGDALPAPRLGDPPADAQFPASSLIEFSWSRVEGAVAYEYSIEYEDYPSANAGGVVADTFHVERIAEIGSVIWRVRARSADTPGIWSTPRRMNVNGAPVSNTSDFEFQFTTESAAVGERIRAVADRRFATSLLAAIQAAGAEPADLRRIAVEELNLAISQPTGTTLDDFAEWRLILRLDTEEVVIATIPDPAPAVSATGVTFQEPEDWLSVAAQPESELVLSVQINPRSPRSADANVTARIRLQAVLNR